VQGVESQEKSRDHHRHCARSNTPAALARLTLGGWPRKKGLGSAGFEILINCMDGDSYSGFDYQICTQTRRSAVFMQWRVLVGTLGCRHAAPAPHLMERWIAVDPNPLESAVPLHPCAS
jgi:hypothetical protein